MTFCRLEWSGRAFSGCRYWTRTNSCSDFWPFEFFEELGRGDEWLLDGNFSSTLTPFKQIVTMRRRFQETHKTILVFYRLLPSKKQIYIDMLNEVSFCIESNILQRLD
jgi:hypothetical protein